MIHRARAARFDLPERLTGNIKQHEFVSILIKDKNVNRRCRVCYSYNKLRETSYKCKYCKILLHLGNCFQTYYTKKKF